MKALLAVAALLAATPALADDQLRELCSERPGLNTPPCIVDKGHLQVEVGRHPIQWAAQLHVERRRHRDVAQPAFIPDSPDSAALCASEEFCFGPREQICERWAIERVPNDSPAIECRTSTRKNTPVASPKMASYPIVPMTAIGSRHERTTLSPPTLTSALRVSFFVSLNSGANVAGASGP